MTQLRPIKPFPLAGLTPAPFDRPRPDLKWLPPTSLLVDATYQRDLSERSIRLIRKLIENFSWNRMKPVIGMQVGPADLGARHAACAGPVRCGDLAVRAQDDAGFSGRPR